MRRALFVTQLAVLSVGCATVGSALPTFEAASPTAGEGFVALGADSEDHVGTIEFCRADSPSSCFGTRAFASLTEVEVWRLPEGRYCAESLTVTTRQTGASFSHTPRPQLCFDVIEGAFVYPGHLAVRTESSQVLTGSIALGWQTGHASHVREAYPLLESMELRVMLGTHQDR